MLHYGEDGDEWRRRMVDELVPVPPPAVVDSLVVIGNGFDLALGIPSSFGQFQRYFHKLIAGATHDDTELAEIYDLVNKVAGLRWQDFEVGLAELQLPQSVANRDYPDPGDLSDLPGLQQEADEFSEGVRRRLSDTFSEWIHALPSPDAEPSNAARELIEQGDAILTFNYTRTLEEGLGVDSRHVLHIHGVIDGSSDLYFGCPPQTSLGRAGGSYSTSEAARRGAYTALIDGLTKQPRLDQLDAFLTNCNTLRAVGSYGFSFGEADHPYLRRILERCDGETAWTLYCHTPERDTRPLEETDDARNGRAVLYELRYPGVLTYQKA